MLLQSTLLRQSHLPLLLPYARKSRLPYKRPKPPVRWIWMRWTKPFPMSTCYKNETLMASTATRTTVQILMIRIRMTFHLAIHLARQLPSWNRCVLSTCHVFFVYWSYVQIRKSPQARVFFKESCKQVGVQPLELLLWIRTWWGSLYKFLDRILQLRGVRA